MTAVQRVEYQLKKLPAHVLSVLVSVGVIILLVETGERRRRNGCIDTKLIEIQRPKNSQCSTARPNIISRSLLHVVSKGVKRNRTGARWLHHASHEARVLRHLKALSGEAPHCLLKKPPTLVLLLVEGVVVIIEQQVLACSACHAPLCIT